MESTHKKNPSVSEFLGTFFENYRPDADAITRRRIALVRQDLMDHMDDEGWRVLDPDQTVLLTAEAQFRPSGAFARSAHASDLFCILEHYLAEVHAQLGLDQREAQLDVVAGLAEALRTGKHISPYIVRAQCKIVFAVAMKQGREFVEAARAREKAIAR